MSGNCPIALYNPKYKLIFQVRNVDRCDNAEALELYRHIDTKEYLLYRYVQNDNTFPLKVIHRFTSLIGYEMTETVGRVSLFITTIYGNSNIVSNRFTACCGSKIYVLQVEAEILKNLL